MIRTAAKILLFLKSTITFFLKMSFFSLIGKTI